MEYLSTRVPTSKYVPFRSDVGAQSWHLRSDSLSSDRGAEEIGAVGDGLSDTEGNIYCMSHSELGMETF